MKFEQPPTPPSSNPEKSGEQGVHAPEAAELRVEQGQATPEQLAAREITLRGTEEAVRRAEQKSGPSRISKAVRAVLLATMVATTFAGANEASAQAQDGAGWVGGPPPVEREVDSSIHAEGPEVVGASDFEFNPEKFSNSPVRDKWEAKGKFDPDSMDGHTNRIRNTLDGHRDQFGGRQ